MPASALFASASAGQSAVGLEALRLIADSVICTDGQGRILLFNPAAERAFGYTADELIGEHVEVLLPHRFRRRHAEEVQDFASQVDPVGRLMGHSREVLGLRKNGEEFAAEATVSRQMVDGCTILTVVHRDISERKLLEEQREAVAREMGHRIKNMLSVVNSLVRFSAGGAGTVDELKDSLLGRLEALGRTQKSLGGVDESTDLGELLIAELEQFRRTDRPNVLVAGPTVTLSPFAAQAMALTFHELATNSVKYGALSSDGGTVSISFGNDVCEPGMLFISWCESGGPPPSPQQEPGFGRKLMDQMISRALKGTLSTSIEVDGLVCRITAPKRMLNFADEK